MRGCELTKYENYIEAAKKLAELSNKNKNSMLEKMK